MKNYNILKNYCSKIFLVGPGNFWFEPNNTIGDDKSVLYRLFSFVLFSLYVVMTILEIMAVFIGDFPDDEKSDCITFAVSHTIVLIKISSIVKNKEFIKDLNRRMINVCEKHEHTELMNEKYKIMKINVIVYAGVVYGSAVCFMIEGIRRLIYGTHFVTIVTYYPAFEDNSLPATIARIVNTLILIIMMMTMIVSVDSFTMVYLIMYKYKFITLRQYFENLRHEFDRINESGDKMAARDRLCDGLVEGIQMHGEILRLCKDIDKAFGTVMALQLCLSSGSAVSLLLNLALSEQVTLVSGLKIIFFVIALFFLLGLFLCNAGEITYQASLVSDAIFYCGWHSIPPLHRGRNIRKLVYFSITQAQRPLTMKAFKMIELTYGTFIMVVRSTYSVFALIYAQNE